jgi:hypothetical protein
MFGWLGDRVGRKYTFLIARLGRLGFDLSWPGVQPFQRLRELAAALEQSA